MSEYPTSYQAEVLQRLTAIETQLNNAMGKDGNGGRLRQFDEDIKEVNKRVDSHDRYLWMFLGAFGLMEVIRQWVGKV